FSIPFVYGYSYQYPVVSSFSSQVPPYLTSFKIYWSAQYPTEAIYPYSYPITINTPPSGSGYYQQLFTLKPSTYGINSQGSNILFSLPNGTNLYAWIESINSTSMSVWVKVPYGTSTVVMNVYPSSENLFSATGYLGEAPQLSPTYAEYDNGADVFPFYDNFAGTSLSSKWNSGSSGGTITVNNGLTETIPFNAATGSYVYISTNSYQITGDQIVESYANLNSFDTSNFRIVPVAVTASNSEAWHADNSENEAGGGWVGDAFQVNGIDAETTTDSSFNGFVDSNYIASNSNYNIFGIWYIPSELYVAYNSETTPYASTTTYVPTTPLYITISIWLNPAQTYTSTTYPMNVYWVRTRAYLPNGMPTYSIGSPVSPTTSSPITGIVGQYSISFAPTTQNIPVTSYTVTYNITFVATRPNSATETAITSYSITQATDGIYFNASFSFSWSFSNPTLYVSSSYPISWYVNVSHLLNEYPSASYNTISISISPETYARQTAGSNSAQFEDYIFYYNSTSSSADSVTFTITSSELVNYYPTVTYYNVYYSGHGSTETLVVNASNHFNNETLQITNLNWGDGSPTQSSSIETPSNKNYYNFSLSHQYTATGTYTVTFLVVNAVGNPSSLSVSDSKSITLTISVTTTSNALPLKTNQHIYFNYTQVNVIVQEVKLDVNNILVQSNNTTANTNYAGTVSYAIPYYLTQTAEFTATWYYYAGGIELSTSIQYSISNSVPTVGKWVILNYTIGTGPTATKESVPYFYSQQIPYNVSWSYFVWQIFLPSNAVNITVKGSTAWKSPVISVPADFSSSTATFTLLENVTAFQVTWLAPNPVGSALVVIEYYPQSAVFGEFGVNIPFNTFNTYLNGKQIYSPTQQVNLGESLVINTTTVYGTLISSYSTTVSEQTQFIEIPLNIVPLTIDNMNSSYVIGMQVNANGIAQTGQYLMPLQSQVFYVPAGTYNFSFMYMNFNSYSVVKYLNVTMTLSGVSYFVITGVTLTQIDYHVKETQQNITNLVENVNISLANSNDFIKNQIIHLSLNLTNVNSTIMNQINTVETQIKNTNTTLYNELVNVIADVKNSNSTIINQINTILLKLKSYNSTLYNQTLSILANIKNVNTSIINQILTVQTDIKNVNTTLYNQITTAITDVLNTNSTIHTQLNSLLSSLKNDNSTIYNQTVKLINDIINTNSTVKNEALTILASLKADNSTLYNQTVKMITDLKNVNTSIINQILTTQTDISNVNSSI
ncbi:MAG: hypothetical protein QW478_10945, partial [Candidatus Micrarchaeaceae archaeon]